MTAPSPPSLSILGTDPPSRKCVLNGNAFQQDAIRSFNGWQYACFYSPLPSVSQVADGSNQDKASPEQTKPVFVHLSRRKLHPRPGSWETIVFDDYAQTTDDGHNTVQLGICPGDGSIHLSYDHHCDRIRYRHSIAPNLAHQPSSYEWNRLLFTPTLPYLPGLESLSSFSSFPSEPPIESKQLLLDNITYPRFGPLGASSLFFSFRTGKAGSGDDWICVYSPSSSQPTTSNYKYHILGLHDPSSRSQQSPAAPWIKGLTPCPQTRCNPYLNSLTYSNQKLYATWVWRSWVNYPGWDDPFDVKHKQQAGPNGAGENRDLCFAYSTSPSYTIWRTTPGKEGEDGKIIADLEKGESISMPSEEEEEEKAEVTTVTAFSIPRNSGLANQEAQAVDSSGGVHIVNRDNQEEGGQEEEGKVAAVRWKHYYYRCHPFSSSSSTDEGEQEEEEERGGGIWSKRTLPVNFTPTKRGQLATVVRKRRRRRSRSNNNNNNNKDGGHGGRSDEEEEEEEEEEELYFILPSDGGGGGGGGGGQEEEEKEEVLTILKATKRKGYQDYEVFWKGSEVAVVGDDGVGDGDRVTKRRRRLIPTEPLVDAGRLLEEGSGDGSGDGDNNVLSVFTRVEAAAEGKGKGKVEVAVLDFVL